MKKYIVSVLILTMGLVLGGCIGKKVRMPYNGNISFHSINVEIPEEFIRD